MNRKKPLYTFMIAAGSVAGYVSLEKYLESDITIKDLITVLDDTKTKDKNLDFPGTERILDSLQRESEYRDKLIRQLKAETAALEVDLYTSKNYSYTKRNNGISGRGNVRYTHQDETTTKILDMLSGYDDADMWLYLDTLEGGDSVMYKTIRQMHTKYKNPKVEIVEKFDKENTRANYNAYSNSIRLQADTIFYEGHPFDQEYYIEFWISELAHAYQVQKDGIQLYYEKHDRDDSLLAAQNKTYDDLYEIPGTIEYEAHSVIEEKLKKEFIEIYTSLCDTNNIKHIYNLINLNATGGMFEGYCDDEAVERYSEKMFAYVENVFTEEGEITDERIIQHLSWNRLSYRYNTKREENGNDKYREMAKYCNLVRVKIDTNDVSGYRNITHLYVQKGDIENAMKYYALYASGISKKSVGEYVALMFMEAKRYEKAIQIYEDQAKEGSSYAMFCLMRLYDPNCTDCDGYEKDFPYKSQEKKEYREKRFIEKENAEK